MAKQKISRREFLKGTAAAGLGLAATQLLGVAPAAFADAAYKPGKYQATAYGNLSYVLRLSPRTRPRSSSPRFRRS